MIDWNDILTDSIKLLIVSMGTWLMTTVLRLRKDMDAAFTKIRGLEAKGGCYVAVHREEASGEDSDGAGDETTADDRFEGRGKEVGDDP